MQIPENLKTKKILIVDDASSVRMLTRAMLIDAGFKYVGQAKDGKEGLHFLMKRPVDLIFCDWNMPVMGGLDLFKEIKKESALSNIAFVMLTSSSETEKVTEAVSAGITNYMVKPFSAEILLKHAVKALQ